MTTQRDVIDLSLPGVNKIARIICEVSIRHRVKACIILGSRRSRPIAYARMEAMYRIRTELNESLTSIGFAFSRDHTTVLHAVNRVKKCLAGGTRWPAVNERTGEDYEPGDFTLRTPIKHQAAKYRVEVAPVATKSKPPALVIHRKREKPARIVPAEIVVTTPCKEATLASQINAYWAARGVYANARAVKLARRVIVRSDLDMGARL